MKPHRAAILLAALVVFALPLAAAEEVQVDGEAQIQANAGIGPNTPLYGLENALERFRLSMTRDPEVRAQRALDLADERMAEFEAMIEKKDFAAAERARVKYEEFLERAAQSAEEVQSDGSQQEAENGIRSAAQIRAALQLRLDHLDEVYERILEEHGEELSEQQLERIEQAYIKASEKTAAVDARVENKRAQATTRLRVLSDMDQEQAQQRADELSVELQEKIELRAERLIERFEEKLAQINETGNRSAVAAQRLALVFEQKIARAELHARARANATANITAESRSEVNERIREEAQSMRDRFEHEREELRENVREQARVRMDIDVEVHEDYSAVRANIDGSTRTFRVSTTDRAEVTRMVASRLDMSVEDVRAVIEFETVAQERSAEEESETDEQEESATDEETSASASSRTDVSVSSDGVSVETNTQADVRG